MANIVTVIISLIAAAIVYGNLSLIIVSELQKVDFLTLFVIAVSWSTVFLIVFILLTGKIIKFFSRFDFFRKWLVKVKKKAKSYPRRSVTGVVLATITPVPPCGLHAGSIIGLSLGLSKLKTFTIVWLTNIAQFFIMYAILSWII